MRKILIIAIQIICPFLAFGQSTVELEIQLLTSDLIGEVTLDKEPFLEWVKKVNGEVEDHLKKEQGNKEIMVLISLHKEKQATISISSRPKLDNSSIQTLSERIKKLKSPNTKITDYSFAITAHLNGGCHDKEITFIPSIKLPKDQRLSDFEQLDLENKKNSLQNWVKTEIIPIITFYEINVDSVFKGVLNIGEIMQKEKYLNANTNSLTSTNPDYWRATMEMSTGNQLIPFSKICMHIANDEFDIAKRLLFIISFFSDKSSLPAIYHKEISSKLEMLDQQLNTEINKGIAFHDKAKYKEAVLHYESLLKIFPKSAWLNYELYYSKTAEIKDAEERIKEWNKSRTYIYQCDPLYHLDVNAKSGKEGYLLFRRQEIQNLFQSKEKLKADFIKYADIALDLEDYSFAAQVYWLILTYFSKEDYDQRNILAHYLYCLNKLGDKESIKNFKGDFQNEFKKIEKERIKIMEASAMYNAFEKKK
jgi:tetratricopeptide (TPR) repeat protein